MLQVGFVCKSADLYRDARYNVTGSMWVATHYLSTTWLWDRCELCVHGMLGPKPKGMLHTLLTQP